MQQLNEVYEKRYFDAIQATKTWPTFSAKFRKEISRFTKKTCLQAGYEGVRYVRKKTLKKSKGKYFLVQTDQTRLNKEFIILLFSFVFKRCFFISSEFAICILSLIHLSSFLKGQ